MFDNNNCWEISQNTVSDISFINENHLFYQKNLGKIARLLSSNESIYGYRLSASYFEEEFVNSPPYIKTTDHDSLQMNDFGMVIYNNIDLSKHDIYISTQSLHYCTKLVIILENRVAVAHLPIDDHVLSKLTPLDQAQLLTILTKKHGFYSNNGLFSDAKIYFICGGYAQKFGNQYALNNFQNLPSGKFATFFGQFFSALGCSKVVTLPMQLGKNFIISGIRPTEVHKIDIEHFNKYNDFLLLN